MIAEKRFHALTAILYAASVILVVTVFMVLCYVGYKYASAQQYCRFITLCAQVYNSTVGLLLCVRMHNVELNN